MLTLKQTSRPQNGCCHSYKQGFYLLLKFPSGELEVLVVEKVVDQTEEDVGVWEIPKSKRWSTPPKRNLYLLGVRTSRIQKFHIQRRKSNLVGKSSRAATSETFEWLCLILYPKSIQIIAEGVNSLGVSLKFHFCTLLPEQHICVGEFRREACLPPIAHRECPTSIPCRPC